MGGSMEALAMAGADYHEWGVDIEEWERRDSEMDAPPHLLAEEEDYKISEEEEEEEEEDGGVVKAAADCDMKVLVGRALESSLLQILLLLKQLKL